MRVDKTYGATGQVIQAPVQQEPKQEPEQQAPANLLATLAMAVNTLYQKPKATPAARPDPVDQYRGKEWCIEFLPGPWQGRPGKPLDKPPAVRVTAGGRPVTGVPVQFQVSHGELENRQKTIQVQTDRGGIARLKGWQLGDPAEHRITAECPYGFAGLNVVVTDKD